MDCSDLQHVLYPFLDGEYGPEERVDIEGHLAGCVDCARRVNLEAKFRDTVRAKASPRRKSGPKASSGLKRSIMAGLRKEQQRQTQHRLLQVGAVAVLAMAAGGTYAMYRTPSRGPYVEDAAAHHARGLPMEIKDAPPEQVEAWFGDKLDHRVPVPRLANATVTGARLSNVRDRPAAYIRYEAATDQSPSPRRVGLFVFDDAEREVDAPAFPAMDLEQHRGFNVAIWRDGEIVYQLVSDLEEEDIRRMVTSGAAGSPRRSAPPQLDVQPASLRQGP
ncbi:MAG TPA: zf-HC2 domain-containing protein [Myxococcales bacterium]|jgi:anti-sigma factor RsiW|nr:zf-HC2 domain-containing protein [Myxococcales bacterium]